MSSADAVEPGKRRAHYKSIEQGIPLRGRPMGPLPPEDPDFPQHLRMLRRAVHQELYELEKLIDQEFPHSAGLVKGI